MSTITANANLYTKTAAHSALTGSQYCFVGTGAFQMAQQFATIGILASATIFKYDVTNTVQLEYDVKRINSLIGISKTYGNKKQPVTSNPYYDISGDFYTASGDSFTLTGTDLAAYLKPVNVVQLNQLSTLYSDFASYVGAYFGYQGGYASLFDGADTFRTDFSGNLFDGSAFCRLLNASGASAFDDSSFPTTNSVVGGDASGGRYYPASSIKTIAGGITVSGITQLLRFAVDTNCFGNRDPCGNFVNGTGYTIPFYAADASGSAVGGAVVPDHDFNFGIYDGFLHGDLIYVPSGIIIDLGVNIGAEAYTTVLNNYGAGIGFGAPIASSQDTFNTKNNYSEVTTATTTSITRRVVAPLLLKLVNLDQTTGEIFLPST
jgi:hypothetical protein